MRDVVGLCTKLLRKGGNLHLFPQMAGEGSLVTSAAVLLLVAQLGLHTRLSVAELSLAVGNPDAVVANSKCKSVPLHHLPGPLQEFRLPIRCGDRAGHRDRPMCRRRESLSGTYTAAQLQHAASRFADDNVLRLQRAGVPNRSLVSEVCWAQASVEALRA